MHKCYVMQILKANKKKKKKKRGKGRKNVFCMIFLGFEIKVGHNMFMYLV